MPTTPERKKKKCHNQKLPCINYIKNKKLLSLPIVRALAKMTPERMNTMIDALPRNATILLTKNWPQKPAKIETEVRYNAANKIQRKRLKLLY